MFGFKKKSSKSSETVSRGGRRENLKARRPNHHAGPYTPEQRKQAIEAYLKSGLSAVDFAKTWGISAPTLWAWSKAYRERGARGLEGVSLSADAAKRGRKELPEPVKKEITQVKRENPEFGIRKVRDFLWRFRGVKVSSGTVRNTFKKEKIPPLPPKVRKRRIQKPKVQRFERARPMQLWQTDITSYMLARHSQRVYLTVFMDDYSRYVVSWALQLQQTKEFVIETLLQGIQRFGKPEEVLTDQGRQYFSWRGKSDFRKLLSKQGIRHVVARAHHPQTVGKCERFWETVGEEFWDRVEPQDLNDVRERFAHFVNHYNHFRPHQGIDGHVPADRFFDAAADVRKAIEETISRNELRMAVGEAPRKPVFLIGQIGETSVSLHGEKGKLILQMPDGRQKQVDYEEFGHAKNDPTTNPTEEGEANDKGTEQFTGIGKERDNENGQKKETQHPVCDANRAGPAGSSTLGDGNARAAGQGPRSVDRADGVLAGTDHAAGDGRAIESSTAQSLAAVAAGDLGYGGGIAHPTENATAAGSQEHGTSDAERSGKRSCHPEEANCGTGEDGSHAGAVDRGFKGDAGLQRCENPDRAAGGGVSGGSKDECDQKPESESDESSTDGSSS